MFVKPSTKSLHESVLPWLIEKMTGFIHDEEEIDYTVEHIFEAAIGIGFSSHGGAIEQEQKRKEEIIYSAEQKIIMKELERQRRREARETRRKQQEFEKLKTEIKKFFVDKGEVRDHVINQDLLDVNGVYEKNKPFAGALGGQLLQLILTFQALSEMEPLPATAEVKQPAEGEEKPEGEAPPAKKSPADILQSPNLISFLLGYLKELKNDSGFSIQISQHSIQLLDSFKFSLEQLPKLNEEQAKQLKDCMFEHPGHFILKKLLKPEFNQGAVPYDTIGRSLLSALVDIACKKLPADLPFSNKQVD